MSGYDPDVMDGGFWDPPYIGGWIRARNASRTPAQIARGDHLGFGV